VVKLALLPRVWVLGIAVAATCALGYQWSASHEPSDSPTPTAGHDAPASNTTVADSDSSLPRLEVVGPRVGGIVNSTTQPGSVEAYNYANLFAKVSGYLETQSVDIGDRVNAGQVLAQIDAPEIVQAARQAAAELDQSQAQLKFNIAALATTKADLAVARANVDEKQSDLKRATAYVEFREIQYKRMNELFKQKSIDERLVDQTHQERDSAEAAKNLARAAVRTAEADFSGKQALVQQAESNVADARAKVQVANAVLEKAKVYVAYTTLRSPYNGVITKRNFHVGDFVRAAEQGGQTPVLTVAETDRMRVVVKMPEDYVPLTQPGDAAVFKLNFTAHVFRGTVSRIANSVDRNDKTMRTEIDLPNPANELRDGMYGYATIELSKSLKGLSVPSSSLVNSGDSKTTVVFVVRDGQVRRIPVKVVVDSGVRVELLSGLQPDDLVVLRPTEDLTDGQAVQTVKVPDVNASPAEHKK
jgi:HlyD family secretion protein